MLPFKSNLKSGTPIYEQVVLAIKKSIARGELKAGDALPSVREFSRELQINPNTAQKVITALLNEKLIEIKPGIGSIVAPRPKQNAEKTDAILGDKLSNIVVDAISFGISKKEFISAVDNHWKKVRSKEDS